MRLHVLLLLSLLAACSDADESDTGAAPTASGGQGGAAGAAGAQVPAPVPGSSEFAAYSEALADGVTFDMVPIAGGTFTMGSPADESGREEHEGPQLQVTVAPFWMGKYEVTWDEYDVWYAADLPQAKMPDGVSKPTPPYVDMTFNMGRDGFPAICMSHTAARQYCAWLSKKTGRFHRLPTEAEWEYACRAGATTAYSFGDDPSALGDHAWFGNNSEQRYHEVGQKLPNAWGLFDMHGNAAEWVADHYLADAYAAANGASPRRNPFFPPPHDSRDRPVRFPHPVRGGSWRDAPELLRSAARRASERLWNERDPQLPKSWWYLTEGQHVGFRVVRPFTEPSPEERRRFEDL